jgi:nucleotide-binding universal stress UspA family protein
MFWHIMVAFDDSAQAKRALEVAIELARKFKTGLHLITVSEPLPLYAAFIEAEIPDRQNMLLDDLRAMAMLTILFGRLGATPLIESSYDISTDDLKQHNVILLGSSAEDLAVAQIVPSGDFLFEGPESSRDPWSDQIVNSKPKTGEQTHYATVRDPVTHVVQQDYAVISFQPGITPDHEIAILGGIDTTGTEGAALLVTSKAGVEELSNALTQVTPAPQTDKARAFQALVRVDVKKGYQVLDSRLVTLHPVDAAKSAVTRGYSSP